MSSQVQAKLPKCGEKLSVQKDALRLPRWIHSVHSSVTVAVTGASSHQKKESFARQGAVCFNVCKDLCLPEKFCRRTQSGPGFGRGGQLGAHEDHVGPDGVDLPPGDEHVLLPAQQAEQPRPSQQDQPLEGGRLRIKAQIVRPPEVRAQRHLDHILFAQFAQGHVFPLSVCRNQESPYYKTTQIPDVLQQSNVFLLKRYVSNFVF